MQDSRGKIHFTFKGVRLGGCLFLFLVVACTGNKNKLSPVAKQKIETVCRSGDIIVRNGNDEVSVAARGMNRKDKRYSHCGVLQVEHDTVFVYHALGGIYNPSQKLMRQTLEAFCMGFDIDKIAIYRYTLNNEQQVVLKKWVQLRYQEGLPFDLFFNFETNDKMYCSEFVFKALNVALQGALTSILPQNSLPSYVTIDDLYLNDKAKKMMAIKFD